ncbi:MAG TPA: ABC transporter ATP-binding protein [Jatrophihabitans sp.]|nr:ABC transporter ATP-binding protein [Jatrophihabitans sp.]
MSEPGGPPVVVALRGVRKDFDAGAVRALRGVDLEVRRGEWVAITGASGCGKSTLLHLLATLDTPTAGTIEVFGRNAAHLRHAAAFRRQTVGLIFQLHNLIPQLTAAQNVEVAMFGTTRRQARHARACRLLADVDLVGRENRPPTRLSGGERQRVAIARALANDPELLLADEPTGSLDSEGVTRVIELIERLRAQRPELTVIMVTHDERVAAHADRIVTMADGLVAHDQAQRRPRAGGPVSVRTPGDR